MPERYHAKLPDVCLQTASLNNWTVLGFHAEAVLRKPALFVESNAAKYGGVWLEEQRFRRLASVHELKRLFVGNESVRSEELGLAPNQPTNVQAEVMVLDVIEPEAIAFVAS